MESEPKDSKQEIGHVTFKRREVKMANGDSAGVIHEITNPSMLGGVAVPESGVSAFSKPKTVKPDFGGGGYQKIDIRPKPDAPLDGE